MADLPKNLQDRLDEQFAYLEALGRFVHEFGRTERLLAMALHTLSGVSQPVARAIFHAVRVDAAMSYITRILEVTDATQAMKDDFKRAFDQLGQINKVRNDILHYGTDLGFSFDGEIVEPSELIVSNRALALTEPRIREMVVSSKIIDNMINDLAVIDSILLAQVLRTFGHHQEADRHLREVRNRPWLYKSQRPTSGRGKRHAKHPTRKDPPQSSEA